jgi:hypothetical protein
MTSSAVESYLNELSFAPSQNRGPNGRQVSIAVGYPLFIHCDGALFDQTDGLAVG